MRGVRPKEFAWVVVLSLALVSACDNDDSKWGTINTALTGDYTVQSWSHDAQSCDGLDGVSVWAEEDKTGKTLVLQVCTEPFFGTEFLQAFFCDDAASCDEGRCTEASLGIGGVTFGDGSDSVGWRGVTTSAFRDFDTSFCTGSVTDARLSQSAEGLLELHVTIFHDIPQVPLDEEEFCDTEYASVHTDAAACSSVEIVSVGRK
jgi:hypothetical protein